MTTAAPLKENAVVRTKNDRNDRRRPHTTTNATETALSFAVPSVTVAPAIGAPGCSTASRRHGSRSCERSRTAPKRALGTLPSASGTRRSRPGGRLRTSPLTGSSNVATSEAPKAICGERPTDSTLGIASPKCRKECSHDRRTFLLTLPLHAFDDFSEKQIGGRRASGARCEYLCEEVGSCRA